MSAHRESIKALLALHSQRLESATLVARQIDKTRDDLASMIRTRDALLQAAREIESTIRELRILDDKVERPPVNPIRSVLSRATGLPEDRIHNDRHPLDMD